MRVPDISPITFWPVSKDTFNEQEIPGIGKQYYFEVIDPAQVVKIPFLNDDPSPCFLYLFDQDEDLVVIVPFTNVSGNYFLASIDFSGYPALVDTKVSFKISLGADLPGFDVWVIDSGDPSISEAEASTDNAVVFAQIHSPNIPGAIATGALVKFRIGFHTEGDSDGNAVLQVSLNGGAGFEATTGSSIGSSVWSPVGPIMNGDYVYDAEFVAVADVPGGLVITIGFGKIGGTPGVAITTITFPAQTILNGASYNFQSDCVEVIEGGLPISYGNTWNYDGIDFETNGDIYTVYLRGTHFWQETVIDEEEDEKTSSGEIEILRGETTIQRLLHIYQFAPDYIHRKVMKLLKCHIISIDNLLWRKQGASYEKGQVDTSTLQEARVLLTQRDSVLVNLGGPAGDGSGGGEGGGGDGAFITLPQLYALGIWIGCGNWDASTNAFPLTGGTGNLGAILKNNTFDSINSSTVLLGPDGGIITSVTIRAKIDNPTLLAHWEFYGRVTA